MLRYPPRDVFLVLAAACAVACSCRTEPPGPRPSILIVLIDTLRADHTSLYGYERPTTPNLERIASEGLVARNHFANAPWTKPSVASIITGLHPSAHGSRIGGFDRIKKVDGGSPGRIEVIDSKFETLAEILWEEGYRTAAFVSNYHLTPHFGYSQGYDEYEFLPLETADAEIAEACLRAIAAPGPIFVWCHLMAVHQYWAPAKDARFAPHSRTPIPRDAPQARRVKNYESVEGAVAAYDSAIAYDDAVVGHLFDRVREDAPDTLFLVTSDHGEEFLDHGGFEHCHTLYNELLRVPLVLNGPGVPAGEIRGITDSVDVLPTLLHLLRLDSPAGATGQAMIQEGRLQARGKAETYAEQHHRGPYIRRSLVHGRNKLIVSRSKKGSGERVEFFAEGLSDDTHGEAQPADREAIGRLLDRIGELDGLANDFRRRTLGSAKTTELTDEDIRALRALGYVN